MSQYYVTVTTTTPADQKLSKVSHVYGPYYHESDARITINRDLNKAIEKLAFSESVFQVCYGATYVTLKTNRTELDRQWQIVHQNAGD